MYSMVMLVAMSASPEAAAFGNRGCDGGCHGCMGGGLFAGKGCRGGCHGCGGGIFAGKGCCGSGFGCGGACHGCYGGCHGGGLFAGKGCCGGLFAGKGCRGGGCHGCYGGGCHGCYGGGCHGCQGGGCMGTPPADKKDMPKDKKGGVTSAPAYIAVNVPADATITIDGAPTKSTSSTRVFSTPELNAGTVYYYTLVAEVVRDGKTLIATEKVAVEAGASVQITLNPNVAAEVASK
jgi:uncharacterized protein (TIGR03000 family)